MTGLSRFLPKSLTGQLVAVTIGGLVVTQAVMVLVFARTSEMNFRGQFHRTSVMRVADVAELLNAVDPALHENVLRAAQNPHQQFSLGKPLETPPNAAKMPRLEEALSRLLEERGLGRQRVEVFHVTRRGEPEPPHQIRLHRFRRWEGPGDPPPRWRDERRRVFIQHRMMRPGSVLLTTVGLSGGKLLYSRIHSGPRPSLWRSPIVWTTLTTALVLALLIVLAARRISRPLKGLAEAADRLGTRPGGPELQERGPDDVRAAIRAFNRMDRRLNRILDHQRRMIAAVGHDLRTPLTALRLRAEFVADDDNRGRMIRIIDEMQNMTEGILSLVREQAREDPLTLTDLSALAQSLCDDFADMGADVSLAAEPRLVLPLRGGTVARVLRNLIENAVRYGGNADVTVKTGSSGGAVITIEDNGPGIDEAALEQVFEPFVRLETSRNTETGGLGLGLTIARSLVDAEGGTLTLANRPQGGLKVTVMLPRQKLESSTDPDAEESAP